MRRPNRTIRACLFAMLVAGLLAAAQPCSAGETVALASDFNTILQQHLRVMKPVGDYFAAHVVKIDYLEGEPEYGKLITAYWQNGRFRQEYQWLGFTEVFAYNGERHWYGSSLNLPYPLDYGQPADVTTQLVCNFAYLALDQQAYITPPGEVPLDLDERYAVLRYVPPQMSEVLLLLDPADYRLAGFLEGTEKLIADSMLYRLTTFEDWADFGISWYPAVTRFVMVTDEGDEVRERILTAQGVYAIPPLAPSQFEEASAPVVPRPPLSQDPFEIRYSFVSDNVVLRCQTADGQPLRMELDTGANVGLLRRDVAKKLGLTLIGDEQVTGHGGAAAVQYCRVEGLKIEGAKRGTLVEIPPFPAAVLSEDDSLDRSLADHGVAGLLGNFVLNSFITKLDFRRRYITLYAPETFDPAVHLGQGYYALPVHRDSMPFVDITVDGKIRGGAFFNTGAQQLFALSAWAVDAAGLSYEVETVGTGVTVDGFTAFGIVRPELVELGNIEIRRPTTHLELLAPGEAPNPNRIASFGNAFFERYTVTFDLFNQMYYIEGSDLN